MLNFKEMLDNSPMVVQSARSPHIQIYNSASNQNSQSERITMQNGKKEQSIADRRKSRAENLSPVDENLHQKISQLKNDTEKLNYMNKSRQSLLQTVNKPGVFKTQGSTQLQITHSQASLRSKATPKSINLVNTVRPIQNQKLKKLMGGLHREHRE